MAWGEQLLRKSDGSVSVTPRTFPWGFFARYLMLSISVREQIKVNPGRVHGMRKMFSPSCVLAVLLILSSFEASWQGKHGKKGSYSVPLLRTKRDLRDSRGNPTENLKGRPGQGYYISTDLGTPAQRVSSEDLLCATFMVISFAHKHPLSFTLYLFHSSCLKRLAFLALFTPLAKIVKYQFCVLYRTNCES